MHFEKARQAYEDKKLLPLKEIVVQELAKRKEILENLRARYQEEILISARFISEWLTCWVLEEKTRKLFSVKNPVIIFTAPYWGRWPEPRSEASTTHAVIEAFKNGKVNYQEYFNWLPGERIELGHIPLEPALLINNLHPEYLLSFEKVLRDGLVGNYIDNFLEKR
jgi:hypothetical protein